MTQVTDAQHRLQRTLSASIARAVSKAVAAIRLYRWRRLALAFVPLLLVILLGNALLALHNLDTVVAGERAVSHTRAVETHIAVVGSVLAGAESGAKDYVLTGDPADLAPYTSARSTIAGEVARLRALSAGDTVEQARLAALEPLIAQVFAQLQKTIDLRVQQQIAAAIALLRAGYGHQTMESSQAILDAMDATEGRRLDLQMGIAGGNLTAAQITTLLATLADVAVLAALLTLVSRTFTAREQYLRAERAARATAEAALTLRDQFLSVASHELRTPLTILVGNVQLLERRLSRTVESDTRLQETVAAIHRQLARLQTLIDAMLDISRIERGKFKMVRVPLDFADVVRAAIDEVQPTAPAHPIALAISPDAPGANLVLGDKLRLEQVVLNLLQNAIKYSPDGGPIRVEVTRTADQVSLSVSDRGLGIPKEALPHVFEQFYRAPTVRSEHISGMGIGLYIVREIVALHGGTVAVASEQGVGSTFTAHLPLAEPTDTASGKEVKSGIPQLLEGPHGSRSANHQQTRQ